MHLHPAEGPGSLAIQDGENAHWGVPAATQGAPFVRGAVWSPAGNRKTNMLSSPNSEEGDPKGKVSLAGRRAQRGPWNRKSSVRGDADIPVRSAPSPQNKREEAKVIRSQFGTGKTDPHATFRTTPKHPGSVRSHEAELGRGGRGWQKLSGQQYFQRGAGSKPRKLYFWPTLASLCPWAADRRTTC